MHDIEPYFKWRNLYIAADDSRSPFYGSKHDEFYFKNTIYNYYVHPQWDSFGSQTLYMKILFVDYETGSAIIELIGEWNDAINNDIMHLKRNIIDLMVEEGIDKYVLICDNVLNFHGSDDCYYEEWAEDIENGWICTLNLLKHVQEEICDTQIDQYVQMGGALNEFVWQKFTPLQVLEFVQSQSGSYLNEGAYGS